MLFQVQSSRVMGEIPPPEAAILRECLSFTPHLEARLEPAAATPLGERSRRIERLKMYRPGEAAREAESWLRETLQEARQSLDGEAEIKRFCSALSTWAAVQRNLGQTGDAARAQVHALSILRSRPATTEAGYVLHRLAFVLGDLGDIAGGLICAHQAVAVHELTPGGRENGAVATAGLAAFHLFYRHAFEDARAAFRRALDLELGDDIFITSARHGLAYSYLMEGRTDEARERLETLRLSELEPDQALRLDWMEAEIDAADEKTAEALERYAELLPRTLEVMEPSGPILLAIDASALLLADTESGAQVAERWHSWIKPIVETLDATEKAALEPYLDALAAGQLDRELLDQTAVAFKKAHNRMLLGMGRPQAAGRPDLMGRLAA